MKALKLLAILAFVASATASADSYVNGYTRRDGTYVQPHYRSNSDGSTYNNYSSQGNVNPYTGQEGRTVPNYGGYQQIQPIQPIEPIQPSRRYFQ